MPPNGASIERDFHLFFNAWTSPTTLSVCITKSPYIPAAALALKLTGRHPGGVRCGERKEKEERASRFLAFDEGRECVQMRRGNFRFRIIGADIAVTRIVRQDQDDVWSRIGACPAARGQHSQA